ncbi:MAG: hypothetical protein Q8J74_14550 [Candidatus Didemnitutus sp.]|nr:hypothetical protein [Candidatus Didemnitutus sp.]
MNRNTIVLAGVIALAIVIGGFLAIKENPRLTAEVGTAASAPAITTEADNVPFNREVLTRHKVNRAFLVNSSGPDSAISQILRKHPEFTLNEVSAADLQDLYSAYYRYFIDEEATHAKAVPLAEGVTKISIEAFPAEGEAIRNSLTNDLATYFNGAEPGNLAQLIVESFASNTSNFGTAEVELVVSVRNSDGVPYSLAKTMRLPPPSGTGEKIIVNTTYVVTTDDLSQSRLAALRAFFPQK